MLNFVEAYGMGGVDVERVEGRSASLEMARGEASRGVGWNA